MRHIAVLLICMLAMTGLSFQELNYPPNPYVDTDVWNKVSPFFLPIDHPARTVLDEIFSKARVSESIQTLIDAGFKKPYHRRVSKTVVAKHPKLKGYLIKLYTDDQDIVEWQSWLKRISGAHLVQDLIEQYRCEAYFNVPHKWIYPLPAEPSPSNALQRKNFILIVEDMNINHNSCSEWCKPHVTKDILEALFKIVQAGGLTDCTVPDNIPFSKVDGRIVFIDTETHHVWPVGFQRMTEYLNKDLQTYWRSLYE